MATLCNDTQLKKARSPMLFSDCEDGILLRETQSEKAELPMDDTVSGTTAFFKDLQFLNALLSIFSTPDGRIASGKDSHP